MSFSVENDTLLYGTGFYASKRLENLCPESCLLIVVGIALGIITYFSSDQNEIIEFDTDIFFTVILPPIIMEAGYFMPTRAFFDQLGTILLHAIIATMVLSPTYQATLCIRISSVTVVLFYVSDFCKFTQNRHYLREKITEFFLLFFLIPRI